MDSEALKRLAHAIAAEKLVDPRSVEKEIRSPGSVRGGAGRRIREALAARGMGQSEARPS